MDGTKGKARLGVDLTAVQQPANDSRPVFERLRDYASRGADAPESLSLVEVRQIAFALSLYLGEEA